MQIENLSFYTLSSKELSKKSGIYKLSAGGHVYVGSSKNLYSRLTEHRHDLETNQHKNSFLTNVVNKHGINNVRIDIIEYCAPEDRIVREKFWIDELKADMNLQDPISHELSEQSKQKLSQSVRAGLAAGKYKTKYDFCKVECYDYWGNYITTFDNKEDAAKKLNVDVQAIMHAAGGYKKGVCLRANGGCRLRYSDSTVPVQTFEGNPQYIGKYYDFYYIDENGNEQFAFSSVKDCWKFFGTHAKLSEIKIIPKLKFQLCESGNVQNMDNPNPSTSEME